MQPITMTPIFARVFDAMDIRDRGVGFIVGGCIPSAHGAGSLQVDVSAGTFVSNSGAFTAYGGGNVTPAALVNPAASRCDLIYFTAGGALALAAGVEVVVGPNTAAVPPVTPAGGTPVGLAYITPGAIDYTSATTAFVEDITQSYAPTYFPDGTAAAPSITFGNQKNAGFYRVGAGNFRAVAGGRVVLDLLDQGGGAQDYVQVVDGSGAVYLQALGVSANVDLNVRSKGTGAITFASGGGARVGFRVVDNPAAIVNYVFVEGNVTTGNPIVGGSGSDANVGLDLYTQGTGANFRFVGGAARVVLTVIDVASAVNYIQLQPSGTGGEVTVAALGTDTNIGLQLTPKGTGVVDFVYASTPLGGGAAPTFGTIGASGPAAAAQNSWLKVNVNGAARFIPIWA